jgi:hypothetical protein
VTQKTLYLIWRSPDTRAQYRIGDLSFTAGHYRFRYDLEGVRLAEAGGFHLRTSPLYPSFPDVSRVYESPEMPGVIAYRLPDRGRDDYADLLARKGLSASAHPFDVLRATRGRLATDQLFFEEAPGRNREGNDRLAFYVAGWTYYSGEAVLSGLRTGDPVHLVPEESNPSDPFATIVLSDRGHKLGYVPSFHSETVASAFPEGRRVQASIAELNPPPSPPEERLKLEVLIGSTNGTLSETEIKTRATEKLRFHQLPRSLPRGLRQAGSEGLAPIIIGGAVGKVCSVCDEVLANPHELITEFRYLDGRSFVFHHRCFEIWSEVRQLTEQISLNERLNIRRLPMSRTEQVIVVFVASPSDLEAERNRLEEVIQELNSTWSRTLGARLELVRWETHGYPGIAEDPQGVLNRQLPNDYQIFVGLLWGKYGSATARAGSGTEEEFQRALTRFHESPDSVKIMFYFKDAPLPPSTLDPEQLAKVQQFRRLLGDEGALYWTFVSLDEFERLIRLHLTRQIQELLSDRLNNRAMQAASNESLVASEDETDEGLLDLLDAAEKHFTGLVEITGRIAAETKALVARIEERTKDIQDVGARAPGHLSRAEFRAVIEKAAFDMNQYVARVRTELPLFRDNLQRGADAVARAALITADFDSEDRRQVREARGMLSVLDESLAGAFDATGRFRASVQGLPRMTVILNRAKRETAEVLTEVQEGFAAGRRVVGEAGKTLDALLGDDARTA